MSKIYERGEIVSKDQHFTIKPENGDESLTQWWDDQCDWHAVTVKEPIPVLVNEETNCPYVKRNKDGMWDGERVNHHPYDGEACDCDNWIVVQLDWPAINRLSRERLQWLTPEEGYTAEDF